MTIKQKTSLAAQNHKLYFFKEGLFCKVYNQNAMWFNNNIKAYKINSKFVKTVNQQVFNLGFPQNVLVQLINKPLIKIEETTSFISYKINHTINPHYSWFFAMKSQNSNRIGERRSFLGKEL